MSVDSWSGKSVASSDSKQELSFVSCSFGGTAKALFAVVATSLLGRACCRHCLAYGCADRFFLEQEGEEEAPVKNVHSSTDDSVIEDEERLAEERRKRDEQRRLMDEEEAEEERKAQEQIEKLKSERDALLRAETAERVEEEAAAEPKADATAEAKSEAATPKDEEAASSPSNVRRRTGTGKTAGVGGADKDAQDAANKEWNKSAKKLVEGVQANDPTCTIVNLNENTVFAMKHTEYCETLFAALASNTQVTEVHLKRCALSTFDMSFVAKALGKNSSIRVLDLENNKIDNNGAIVLAEGLKGNSTLIELNLLGQGSEFGDQTLTAFLQLFDHNITLTKVIWRLNSRKSFAINKLIVRNNTIKKWVNEGKSVKSILPGQCNVSDLSVLMDDGKTYTPKAGAEEPAEALDFKPEEVAVDEAPPAHSATASVVEDAEGAQEKTSVGKLDVESMFNKDDSGSVREEKQVGKLDANALFVAKAEAPREEKVVGKIDSSAFSKKEEEDVLQRGTSSAGREVGKLKVEEKFQPVSQIEIVPTASDKPVEIGKLAVETRYKPQTAEVKSTVEKPEKIGKLNAAEKFKPVSQVEVKRTVEDLPTVGKLNLRAKGTPASGGADDARGETPPAEEGDDKAVKPGKLDVAARYKPPALAEASGASPAKEEVGKMNVAERYKVAKTEVASAVDKPEVKKMNVADRFKPVSQIEVKRAVETSDSVGRLQVGPIESQIEVVKQVPNAGSLEDLIAHDSKASEEQSDEQRREKEAERERREAEKEERRQHKAEIEAKEKAHLEEAAREKAKIEKRAAKAHAHELEVEAKARAEAEAQVKEDAAKAKQHEADERRRAAEAGAAEDAEEERKRAEARERRSKREEEKSHTDDGAAKVNHEAIAAAEKQVRLLQEQVEQLQHENSVEHKELQKKINALEIETKETQSLKSKVEQLEANNKSLLERAEEASGAKGDLETRLREAEERVAQLTEQVASLKAAPPTAIAIAPSASVAQFKSWKEFFTAAEVPESAAAEYASLFEDAEIELSQALDLTKDELATLDVKLGHQMKITKLIAKAKQQ